MAGRSGVLPFFVPARQTAGTMCVTRSALTQRIVPVSTHAIWNRVGTFGLRAPPSMKRTSPIHQDSSSVTTTLMPGLTLRKRGFFVGYLVAADPWSSDICCCHPCGFLKRFPPLGLQGQPHLPCCSIGQVSTFFEQWWTAGHPSAPVDEDACLVP